MATFVYEEKKKRSIENGKIVTKKHDAIRFNGRVFSIGDIIGFQYSGITVVGRLAKIDKDNHTIYVSVRTYGKEGIYCFYIRFIDEVYGTY